jgi:hypothetical protein
LLIIPDEWKEKFLAKIETWKSVEFQEKQLKIDRCKSELALLKVKIDRLNNGFTEGSIDIAEFRELKNPFIYWPKPWSPSALYRTTTHDVRDGGEHRTNENQGRSFLIKPAIQLSVCRHILKCFRQPCRVFEHQPYGVLPA